MSLETATAVIATARTAGIDTLDTATLYGDSELRLGRIGVEGWEVVSKLAAVPPGCPDVRDWVFAEVAASLARLGIAGLSGLMLHRPGELGKPHGPALFAALEELKRKRIVRKIGVSIYEPGELDEIVGRYAIDLVQAPLNVLDRRLVQSGWLDRLSVRGIEVHARSVFLQGLLLMSRRPAFFEEWEPVWRRWDSWLARHAQSSVSACLGFVLSFPAVARVVVGVDNVAQLQTLIKAAVPGGTWPEEIWSADPRLLNPSQWPRSQTQPR